MERSGNGAGEVVDQAEARAGELIGRVEALLERLESLDESARSTATDAVRSIVDLYGEGMARMVERGVRSAGDELVLSWTEDELVAHLFLLHDLHPEDPETRVGRALDEVRPYLRSHGGNVELKGVEDGVAHLRLQGSCDGCPSSRMTLEMAIEDAVRRLAPDVLRIDAEGAAEPPQTSLVQITASRVGRGEGEGEGGGSGEGSGTSWTTAGGLPQLVDGGPLVKNVSGERVLFLKVDDVHYAYRPQCPVCEASLEQGTLEGAELACAGCGRRYDARRAGRCLDVPDRHLEPIPLLVGDSGIVKVALPAGVG